LEVVVFRPSVRVLCLAGSLASITALLLGTPLGTPLGAQEKSSRETKAANNVPQSAQPPAGLCRVWLENVPAGQQPAPTDCATAIKNRPQNARIVFGNLQDEAAKPQQKTLVSPSSNRISGWPNRQSEPARRFDNSPGVPSHPSETRANDGAGGVHPVASTVPVVRPPTSDSGPKRRP
jgi:hypothetical protein